MFGSIPSFLAPLCIKPCLALSIKRALIPSLPLCSANAVANGLDAAAAGFNMDKPPDKIPDFKASPVLAPPILAAKAEPPPIINANVNGSIFLYNTYFTDFSLFIR